MKTRRIKFSFLIFLLMLLAAVSYLGYCAFWIDEAAEYKSKPFSLNLSNIKNLMTNSTIYLNSDDVNGLLKIYMNKINQKDNYKVDNLYCTINNSSIRLYAIMKYKQVKFMIVTEGKLSYEQDSINYYPDNFKLGKLQLPTNLVLTILSNYVSVNAEEQRIELSKNILPIRVDNLQITDGKIMIKLKF